MIKTCSKWGCNNKKLEYCNICYNKLYIKNNRLGFHNKILWLVLIGIISILLILPYLFGDIDEGKFCEDKLNKWFPEYNFNSATYNGIDTCAGKYQIGTNETRDGLKVVNLETKEKVFKLLNQEDIDYLHQDNWKGWLVIVGLFGFLIIYMIIVD